MRVASKWEGVIRGEGLFTNPNQEESIYTAPIVSYIDKRLLENGYYLEHDWLYHHHVIVKKSESNQCHSPGGDLLN
jgi:hypothetical protein